MTEPNQELSELQRFRRELASRDLDKTYSLTLEVFKWFVTTALALNGAALVALIGANDLRPLIASGPGFLFGAGVVLALLAALAIILAMIHIGKETFDALWRGDNLDVTSFDEFAPKADEEKKSEIAGWLLFGAIFCFVVGCIWTGVEAGMVKPSKPQPKLELKK